MIPDQSCKRLLGVFPAKMEGDITDTKVAKARHEG